jgi:hypothetical protein
MPIVISGTTGMDMGNKPISNTSQVDSTVINENGSNVISQSELAYDADTSSYIPNTLVSGAIIERGSNANSEYIKFADGTMICICQFTATGNINNASVVTITRTTPASFFDASGVVLLAGDISNVALYIYSAYHATANTFTFGVRNDSGITRVYSYSKAIVFGRWK